MRTLRTLLASFIVLLCLCENVFAQAGSNNYRIPSDVQAVGGGDAAKSGNYVLLDTIGEPNIGPSNTPNYALNAGYRQQGNGTYISLSCTPLVDLGTITGNGQNTNDGTCTVITDATAGYSLHWSAGPAANGLIAYWPLDESSGTSSYDLSGYENTGTHNGSPTISSDVPRRYVSTRSLSFNGSNSVTVPDDPALDITNNFTLSFWMKPTNLTQSNKYLVSKLNNAGSDNAYSAIWEYTNDSVEFYAAGYTGSDPRTGSAISIPDTNWHLITYTYDGTTWSGYRDGTQIFSVARTFSLAQTTGNFFLSTFEGSGFYFNGKLDDVRLYNRALQAEEVRDLASTFPPGSMVTSDVSGYVQPYNLAFSGSLVGHWRLDDMVGTVAADASRFGFDATLTNGPTFSTDVPAGTNARTYRSVLFDGSDDYIITPNMNGKFANDDVTISVWFYPTAPGVIIDELGQVTPNTGWHDSQLEILSDNSVRARVWNLSNVNLGTATLNAWNHAVLRYNDATDTLDGFLNGVQSSTVSGNRQTPWVEGGAQLYYAFGVLDSTHTGDGTYFNGKIDDVKIYNAALTDAQILSLSATPQLWSVPVTESAFGARLRSSSTDTNAKWGTDGASSKWLNVGDAIYPLVTRSTRTALSGSTEIIQYRAEIGNSMIQAPGTYTSVITYTAVSL